MPWITMLRGKLRANGCQGGRYSFGPREMEPSEPAYFETLSFWNGIYWTYLECRFERLCAWSVQQQVIPCGCRATSKAPESPKCSLDLTRQQWKMIIFKLHDTLRIPLCYLVLFGSIWSVQVLLLASDMAPDLISTITGPTSVSSADEAEQFSFKLLRVWQ